jgi:hypothetical protein
MNPARRPAPPVTRIADGLPRAYFQEASAAFSRARQASGFGKDVLLRLGGMTFRLRFADDISWRLILPSLAHHLVEEDARADWTIHLWDDASTHSAMEAPTPVMLQSRHRECVAILSDDRHQAYYQEWMGTLSVVDREGEAYVCYLNAAELPMYEKAAPMRQVFNTALNARGRQIVHAAALGSSRGSFLLAGAARSGKSTLAVQCLLDGFGFQSDDLCLLSQDSPPQTWNLYNVAKLREDSLGRIPPDLPLVRFTEGTETKYFFHVHEVRPGSILPAAPLKAVLIPQITTDPVSRLVPAARLDAMRALVPWSLSEIPASDNLGVKIMLKALGQVPAYTLHLGSDPQQTLALLREHMDGF